MRRLVIGADVITSWFEGGKRNFRDEYAAGLLHIYVPPNARLDLIDRLVATNPHNAERIISCIDRLRLELVEPPAEAVGRWMRRGLQVGAASYAALAESLEVPLVTADPDLLAVASPLILRSGEISGYPDRAVEEPPQISGYPDRAAFGGRTDAAR